MANFSKLQNYICCLTKTCAQTDKKIYVNSALKIFVFQVIIFSKRLPHHRRPLFFLQVPRVLLKIRYFPRTIKESAGREGRVEYNRLLVGTSKVIFGISADI